MESEPSSSSKVRALSRGTSGYSSRLNDTQSATASSSHDVALMSSNNDIFRITEIDTDSQALVARSQGLSLETQLPHHIPNQRSITYSHEPVGQISRLLSWSGNQSIDGNHDSEASSNTSYQEQLRQLQHRIDDMQQNAQQTEQQTHQKINDIFEQAQLTDQLIMQKQIDDILQTIQQTSEQTDQKINNILERVQQTDQQSHKLQQQMEDVLQKVQQADQQQLQQQKQIDDIIQQGHEMLQQMRETGQDNRQAIPFQQQTREEFRQFLKESLQLQRQEVDRLMVIKSHIQALLARSFKELPIPRLFIVLPNTPGHVDGGEN
ncbi:hypothetical protein BGZ65_012144, partial [Modicella reniformis]